MTSQLMSELASRAKAVSEDPDNYYTKAETLVLMKQVKALAANGDKMAQYQLAQLYPKHSTPYLHWMQTAAQQGFTNALLALSRDYAATETVSGLQKAARYVVEILVSNDSYIKTEAEGLMRQNRLLSAEVQRQMTKSGIGKSTFGLFAHENKELKNEQTDLESSQTAHIAPAA